MQFESPSFTIWQQAEKRAAAAESSLFARVLAGDSSQYPVREDVEEVRSLRDAANGLLREMLVEMRVRAASLRMSRRAPGDQPHERGRGHA